MKLEWTRRAQATLLSATDYIREENPEKAREIITNIHKLVGNLKIFPNMGVKTKFLNVRDLISPECDFIARYKIKKDVIEILVIWHASQNRDG